MPMATISVGGSKSGRRALVHELPLVPFVDYMICLVAFLIVTAVWMKPSSINATGQAPGALLGLTAAPPKELHVSTNASTFELRWQQGATVLTSRSVPRAAERFGDEHRYPALSQAITEAWLADGQHRAPSDARLDRAVLHVPDDVPFSEIVALLDALHAPRRGKASAFDVALASN